MTYSFRNEKISFGLGSSSSLSSEVSESSSSMISLQRSIHSSQMYTPGPAISFLTCFCDLQQNEHFSRSPPSPNLAICPTPHSVPALPWPECWSVRVRRDEAPAPSSRRNVLVPLGSSQLLRFQRRPLPDAAETNSSAT